METCTGNPIALRYPAKKEDAIMDVLKDLNKDIQ